MTHQWTTMIPEILQSISDRLPLIDFLAFRSTCPSWRSAPSGRSEIFKFKIEKDKYWLMLYDVDHDDSYKCYIYSDSHPTCCTFRLPDLKGATIVESKLGWFLAHRHDQLFFFNPFSLEKIAVAPPIDRLSSDQAFTFSGLPTSSNCTVYVIDKFKIMSYNKSTNDANKWHIRNIDVEILDEVHWIVMDAYTCGCDRTDCEWKTILRFTLCCPTNMSLVGYDYDLEFEGFYECTLDFGDYAEVEVFKELKELHGDDWIERGGGRRRISMSSLGTQIYSMGIYAGTWDIMEIDREKKKRRIDGDDDGQSGIIKAAWINPCLALE